MPKSRPKSQVKSKKFPQTLLSTKLKERLGYSGIYSQRNSQKFFEQLSAIEQQRLLQELKIDYYQILVNYFNEEKQINQQIDRFVETAFFVNLPVSQVVELHMELIEDLERECKIEGLHPDFLSDYRLTLIDVITHLGEMYRSVIQETCLFADFAS